MDSKKQNSEGNLLKIKKEIKKKKKIIGVREEFASVYKLPTLHTRTVCYTVQ